MISKLFRDLTVGQEFYKNGELLVKTDPVKSGGCGCRIEANAINEADQLHPKRLFNESDEVQINE
jgi:hypothetical protein